MQFKGTELFSSSRAAMASMIKTMYTFDPDFDAAKVDDPTVHPAFSARPEGSPIWDEFPRVIYHTCDQAAFNSIIRFGLIPGGFPYKNRQGPQTSSTGIWTARRRRRTRRRRRRTALIKSNNPHLAGGEKTCFLEGEEVRQQAASDIIQVHLLSLAGPRLQGYMNPHLTFSVLVWVFPSFSIVAMRNKFKP